MMFDWIVNVPPTLEFLILFAAAVGALYSLHRYVYRPVKAFARKANDAIDSLVGYPPIVDKGGTVLKPATPPLALRVETLEHALTTMINTQDKLVNLERDLANISVQLQERAEHGTQIVEEWMEWRGDIEGRFKVWVEEQDQLAALIRDTQDDQT